MCSACGWILVHSHSIAICQGVSACDSNPQCIQGLTTPCITNDSNHLRPSHLFDMRQLDNHTPPCYIISIGRRKTMTYTTEMKVYDAIGAVMWTAMLYLLMAV